MVLRKNSKSTVQNRKRYIKRKRSAAAQSKQILTNLRSIESLKEKERGERQFTTLQHQSTNNALTDIQVHPIVPCLTGSAVAPAWDQSFWSQSTISNTVAQATCGRIYMNFAATAYSEKQPVTFSLLHVKLVPSQADYIMETQGLGLSGITSPDFLMRGVSVVNAGIANTYGTINLNPKYFKTVKRWDFTLGSVMNDSTATTKTTVLANSHKAFSYSFPTGYKMGNVGLEDWDQAPPESICKNENLNFFIVASDNLTGLDLGNPSYTMQFRTTCTARV
ncbi:MAG: putative capsid protein [Circoviridae sp.]|nr:MAG: putative capsid protein [Circoviridae sp.]